MERAGALCARVDGIDLHGRVAFGAADRERLEAALAIDGRSVDPRQLLGSLEGRIDVCENGELKRIDPPSWYGELK